MSPAAALTPQPGERVLDLCAAPGGKSTQMGAAMAGRGYVIPEDVKKMAVPVLAHRLSGPGGAGETGADTFLMRLISEIPVPVERDGGLL